MKSSSVYLALILVLILGCGPQPHPTPAPELAFTPDLGPMVHDTLSRAQERVLLASYQITDDHVTSKLIEKCNQGLYIKVLVSERTVNARGSDVDRLRDAGIEVRAISGIGLFHEKFLVTENTAMVMSANMSDRGLNYNYEVGIRIVDPQVVEELAIHFLAVWTGGYQVPDPDFIGEGE